MTSPVRRRLRRLCVVIGVLAVAGAFGLRVRARTAGAPLLLPQEVSPLRVLSWNIGKIYMGGKRDSRASDQDLWRIAEVIRETHPDLVALQELRDAGQLERLERLLGDAYVGHVPEEEINDRRVGVLVRKQPSVRFSDVVTSTGRSVAVARLPLGSRFLTFASVHLDAFNPELRREQAEEIVDWAGRTPDRDLVLAGDFNFDADFLGAHDPQHSDLGIYHLLTAHFEDAARDGHATTIVDRRLDYLFSRGRLRHRGVHVLAGKSAKLMDHEPVMVDFDLAPML